VAEAGDPDGLPVLTHHGTPGAGLLFDAWHMDASVRGLRLLSYDRPGYGGSARDPGRTVASAAADAAAIADGLGFERFATWGSSGGATHALACAALLGERVVACAAIASLAPFGAEGLDYFAGMGDGAAIEAARAGEEALRPLLASFRAGMIEPGADLAAGTDAIFTAGDQEALRGPYGEYLKASFQAGLRGGVDGWVDDELAYVAPWGFDPGSISVPVQLWQGRQDRMVPYAHGVWLAGRLPRVDARMSPDDGHLTLTERRAGEVLDFLRERF
jgi:pimeloyl-ACP methyl ester carboxylesterase